MNPISIVPAKIELMQTVNLEIHLQPFMKGSNIALDQLTMKQLAGEAAAANGQGLAAEGCWKSTELAQASREVFEAIKQSLCTRRIRLLSQTELRDSLDSHSLADACGCRTCTSRRIRGRVLKRQKCQELQALNPQIV